MTVNLDQNEWNAVLALLSQAPWRDANPLIMRIGDQLRMQTPKPNGASEPMADAAPPERKRAQ